MVEVTQADREAAWPYRDIRYLPDRQTRERWFAGYYDRLSEGVAIQAFARHRLAEREAVVKWLPKQPPHLSLQEYADAIEAGEPFK